ncbi:MAG: hypothetical protein LUG93_14335 [Lachnospiraceae bacterium]|nr:hypothetical protein [Lachnospiraceae bacterium]
MCLKEIIQLVLKDLNGNQSAAAKRLEIGRSTIWRYLKSKTPMQAYGASNLWRCKHRGI